jgi:hypothetical protein
MSIAGPAATRSSTRRGDSNPHGSPHHLLKMTCLYVSALPRIFIAESMDYGSGVLWMDGWKSRHQLKINWKN